MSMTAKERVTKLFGQGCDCAAIDIGVGIQHEPMCGWPRPEQIESEMRAHANAALDAAAKEIRDFQDMVGWQKYDSRNQLIQDIEEKVRALREEG